MKIAVIGSGAVGSLIGGLLSKSGEDITLIAKENHAHAINEKGLRISGALGDYNINVKAKVVLDFKPDLAILAVKTQDIESSVRPVSNLLKDVPVVTLQNGVRSDNILKGIIGGENIISGIVMFNAQYLEPGKVIYAQAGALLIGEAFKKNGERVEKIRAVLDKAIKTSISNDIRGAHYAKLLVNNLGNGLEAITGTPMSLCMKNPGITRIGFLAMKEGYKVIRKSGHNLASMPGVPSLLLKLIIMFPPAVGTAILRLSLGSMKTMSSTLQSIRRGKPTEIDYLNGEIVRIGKEIGMRAPYNSMIVDLVKEAEKTGKFLSAVQILKIIPGRLQLEDKKASTAA